MSRPIQRFLVFLLAANLLLTGCTPAKKFYFLEDENMAHYIDVASESQLKIDEPDTLNPSLDDVQFAHAPLAMQDWDEHPPEFWDLPLQEAIQTALANSKVLRVLGPTGGVGTTASASETIRQAPDTIQTIYDPAITETDPRFGVQQALSAFDAQFSTQVFWEKNETPQNFLDTGVAGDLFNRVVLEDTGQFAATIAKRNATGGQTSISMNTLYQSDNRRLTALESVWTQDFTANIRQPLLRGAGSTVNHIIGNGQLGFLTGISIARINTDIALADFEANVRNLVSDVEQAYWDLYFQYRNLEAQKAARDSALASWQRVKVLFEEGAEGGDATSEARARQQYYQFRARAEDAQRNLIQAEMRLRYMMGIAPTDGRLIRPADDPLRAKVDFDWHEVKPEALVRNPELRRQKWTIKQTELELVAAKNFLLPQLDFVGEYRWVGLGDDLIDPDGTGEFGEDSDAFSSLTQGDFQEWQLGLEFSLPIGFRRELAAVRNSQLQLARDRAVLQDMELEVIHDLTDAIHNLEYWFKLSQTNFNRVVAAKKEVEAVDEAYKAGLATLDTVLDAQARLADAQTEYFRTLVEYTLAISNVHFRKGSLLEYDSVYLAEGPWPKKAYFDARELARQRNASIGLDYGFSRPRVFSRGEFPQFQEGPSIYHGEPTMAPAEEVPAPEGEPIEPGARDGRGEGPSRLDEPQDDFQPPQFDFPEEPPQDRTTQHVPRSALQRRQVARDRQWPPRSQPGEHRRHSSANREGSQVSFRVHEGEAAETVDRAVYEETASSASYQSGEPGAWRSPEAIAELSTARSRGDRSQRSSRASSTGRASSPSRSGPSTGGWTARR